MLTTASKDYTMPALVCKAIAIDPDRRTAYRY